jgi:hypothetical protein
MMLMLTEISQKKLQFGCQILKYLLLILSPRRMDKEGRRRSPSWGEYSESPILQGSCGLSVDQDEVHGLFRRNLGAIQSSISIIWRYKAAHVT